MKLIFVLVLLQAFAGLLTFADEDELSAINRLREELFFSRGYDRHARPVNNTTKSTNITINYFGIRNFDLDVQTGTLHTTISAVMTWMDELLTWNPSDYDGIAYLIVDTNEIWMPGLHAWNSVYGASHYGSFFMEGNQLMATLYSNGSVNLDPKLYYTTRCSVDLKDYPKDTQVCTILFGSFTYRAFEMNITLMRKKINCESEDTVYACQVNEKNVSFVHTDAAFLKFVVQLTRKGSFYLYMVELPYWTAAFLACASLFLPPSEFHVKFVFGLLAVGIDFYLLLFIFTEIGFHSVNTPYIVKCVSVNFSFVSIYLMMSSLISQVLEQSQVRPPRILVLIQEHPLVDTLFGLQRTRIGSSQVEKAGEWSLVSVLLDKVIFIFYVFLLFVYHS